jgi:hypothetical protein
MGPVQADDMVVPNDADYTYDEEEDEEVEVKNPHPLNKSGVTEKAIVKTNVAESDGNESDKQTPKLIAAQSDPGQHVRTDNSDPGRPSTMAMLKENKQNNESLLIKTKKLSELSLKSNSGDNKS